MRFDLFPGEWRLAARWLFLLLLFGFAVELDGFCLVLLVELQIDAGSMLELIASLCERWC